MYSRKGSKPLLNVAHPDVAAEFSVDRNDDVDLATLTIGSGKPVWWGCSAGHEWQARTVDRVGQGRNPRCPDCRRGEALGEGALSVRFPDIAAEWHESKNGAITPDQVLYWERRDAWWRCADGHEWRVRIESRTTSGSGCGDCYRNRSAKRQSLEVAVPSLARQWHPSRNGTLTPSDVSPGSGREVWWLCRRGHEWSEGVGRRVRRPDCAYCSGRRVTPENCFAALRPTVASQWHPSKNDRTPDSVLPGSDHVAWWICEEGHEWQAPVEVRSRGVGCNECRLTLNPSNSLAHWVLGFAPPATQ